MAYTYSKIATYTVGSGGVASIDFLAIPQNYTDLKVVFSVRNDRAASIADTARIQFNFDTGNNYSYRYIYGNGSAAASSNGSSAAFIECFRNNGAASTANTFSNNEIYIPNYTGSNYKSVSVDSVQENNATTANAALVAGIWSNSSPINGIKLYTLYTTMQYSTATLYGIKAEV
jgi:hypothetical protein